MDLEQLNYHYDRLFDELRKHSEHLDNPRDILLHRFSMEVFSHLCTILLAYDQSAQIAVFLQKYLADVWKTINGSMLAYTATINTEVTRMLLYVAEFVVDSLNTEHTPLTLLQVLMPSVNLTPIDQRFPDLKQISSIADAFRVLQTHILGTDGRYLIPIALIIDDPDKNGCYLNPYLDRDSFDDPQFIDDHQFVIVEELARINQHSVFTRNILADRSRYQDLRDQKSLSAFPGVSPIIELQLAKQHLTESKQALSYVLDQHYHQTANHDSIDNYDLPYNGADFLEITQGILKRYKYQLDLRTLEDLRVFHLLNANEIKTIMSAQNISQLLIVLKSVGNLISFTNPLSADRLAALLEVTIDDAIDYFLKNPRGLACWINSLDLEQAKFVINMLLPRLTKAISLPHYHYFNMVCANLTNKQYLELIQSIILQHAKSTIKTADEIIRFATVLIIETPSQELNDTIRTKLTEIVTSGEHAATLARSAPLLQEQLYGLFPQARLINQSLQTIEPEQPKKRLLPH